MPKYARLCLLSCLLTCCLGLWACQPRPTPELQIAAAASLRNLFEELAPRFEAQTGVKPAFSFAASGVLRLQIEQSAPFAVFASASREEVNKLQSHQHVVAQEVFARNQLQLARRSPELSCQWPAVAKGRLAIGNPQTVPAGVYARELLQSLKLWDSFHPQLILAEHVRQVVEYLRQGAVDYGLVYSSDLQVFGKQLHACPPLDPGLYRPIELSIAILAPRTGLNPEQASAQQAQAQKWLDFLKLPESQQTIQAYGFGLP